jgi:two-component system chemotaxis sensor kinase CheA
VDLAKYRALFLEEATENLAEISGALLELEKDTTSADAIETIFRGAHSVKGMAASLGYDTITEVAHAMEDRMSAVRSAGRLDGPDALGVLFRGLEGLEAMLRVVRETGEPPPASPELVAELEAPVAAGATEAPAPKKKSLLT